MFINIKGDYEYLDDFRNYFHKYTNSLLALIIKNNFFEDEDFIFTSFMNIMIKELKEGEWKELRPSMKFEFQRGDTFGCSFRVKVIFKDPCENTDIYSFCEYYNLGMLAGIRLN